MGPLVKKDSERDQEEHNVRAQVERSCLLETRDNEGSRPRSSASADNCHKGTLLRHGVPKGCSYGVYNVLRRGDGGKVRDEHIRR